MKRYKQIPNYDGAVYSKIFQKAPVYYNASVSASTFIVGWGQAGSTTFNQIFIDNSSEFGTMKSNYR